MKHTLCISVALSLVLTISGLTFFVPKTMAVDLEREADGVYASETFHVPIHIYNVTLDFSVLMDTFLKTTLELRMGDNYIRFHLNDLSVSGHCEYDILGLFAKVTSSDIRLLLFIDTDGIVQGSPRLSIMYYGFF